MSIKIISLNIEGKRHLEKVVRWVDIQDAQVVCLMEVCEEDLTVIAQGRYPYSIYAPNDVLGNSRWNRESKTPVGVAIMSKYELLNHKQVYCGRPPRIEIVPMGSSNHAPILLTSEVVVGEERYLIGSVHFTWTKDGSVSDEQREDLARLLKLIGEEELVMVGDFNFERGGELYQSLKAKFMDNIPNEVITTIDPLLHYANLEESGKLKLVVDYIWSTPNYRVSDVEVVSGVSDHCGLVANVAKI